jgi:hypothetical protein
MNAGSPLPDLFREKPNIRRVYGGGMKAPVTGLRALGTTLQERCDG